MVMIVSWVVQPLHTLQNVSSGQLDRVHDEVMCRLKQWAPDF